MDETTTLEQATDETVDDVDAIDTIDTIDTIDEELLIEEVSIDGMCGVY